MPNDPQISNTALKVDIEGAIPAAVSAAASWLPDWDVIQKVADSAFVTGLVGSGVGAYAGAKAAQALAERQKLREALLAEMTSTNAAIVLTHSVWNVALGFKRRQLDGFAADFEKAKRAVAQVKRPAARFAAQGLPSLSLKIDRRQLHVPDAPIAVLQELVFQKIHVIGRPIALVATLASTFKSLNLAADLRNRFISHDAFPNPTTQEEARRQADLYVGAPSNGHTDTTHADLVGSIVELTDDALFFSQLLIQDLILHAKYSKRKFSRRFKGDGPAIHAIDISEHQRSGVLPVVNQKRRDWEVNFVDQNTFVDDPLTLKERVVAAARLLWRGTAEVRPKTPLIRHVGKTFDRALVDLDDEEFIDCTFNKCTLRYSGGLIHQIGPNFIDCEWKFAGSANRTMNFLKMLHAQGGFAQALVERTWENIIKGSDAQSLASKAPGASGTAEKEGVSEAPTSAGRNELCPCGSGKKYKHCHGALA